MPKNLINELTRQIVHTTSMFKADKTFDDPRFMRVKIAFMHSGINRNNSKFTKEVIEAAKDTFKNIPVLADVITKDDGTLDYSGHSMHIETDAFDETKERIVYDEKVVGIIPETNDFELVYDEETKNYYVYVTALLYRDYGNYVCDILESRNNITDVSAEIACDNISYSAKDKCIVVGTMCACAVTLLGADVKPGMAKAHAEVFSINEDNKQNQLIKIMQELKESLDNYTQSQKTLNSKEGGKETVKFKELLEKYSKTEEDITFEVDGMTDEELEVKFEELFGESTETTVNATESNESETFEEGSDGESTEDTTDETESTESTTSEEGEDGSDNTEGTTVTETNSVHSGKTYSVDENGNMTVSFELSHSDIRTALYNLIRQFEELDNTYYYISEVYDDHFVMEDWDCNYFGCKYAKDGDNVTLDGERYKLYKEMLTESEKAELETLRANYSSIQTKLADYEAKEVKAEKEALFISDDYKSIAATEEFSELKKDIEKYTLDELSNKLDKIITDSVKKGTFSYEAPTEQKKPQAKRVNFAQTLTSEKPKKNSFLDGLLNTNK